MNHMQCDFRSVPCRTSRPAFRCQQAFTLIEVLVVISVISLLIALLLPALGEANRSAKHLRWKAYFNGLRNDPDAIAMYDFEDSSTTSTTVTNKATAGDRAEDYDLKFGVSNGVTAWGGNPTWITASSPGVLNRDNLRFKNKQALYFNGINGTTGSTAGTSVVLPNLQLRSYTIAFWCRPDNLATVNNRIMFAQQTNNPGTIGFQTTPTITARNTTIFRFGAANGSASLNPLGSVGYGFVGINSPWHCFVYSYTAAPDGSATWVAYGDSVTSTGNGIIDPDGTSVTIPKTGFFQLGGARAGSAGTLATANYMGAIDSMAIWSRALDKSEANAFFNMGRD